ncbi:MBL fold metallo-hydrolase [Candidatus Woesearchaeota archaeon]|jgi:putative mRNA 3-end processing factor|nr:MBL fold metallo-hydrolase [Candidatus Woesearchaeota archaeon]MBT4114454.1 MBL fold metallo-hydrolase [Candidatus Woesearchaeota archaeon]MBT4248226.1 MBL fold metallo-hydrolase [Candidatus Woesearchaeota archaeon]
MIKKAKNTIKIHCLGGFREVGRNAVLIEGKTEKILFEYGFKIEGGVDPLPLKVKPDAMFLSHGHLDHLGSIPILYQKWNFPIYGTAPTRDNAEMLLKDSLKIAKINKTPRAFNPANVSKMFRNWNNVRYNQKIKIGKSTVEVYDAGHISGSAMFVLNMDGKRILYTGDFKLNPTRAGSGAKIDLKKIDIILMETTYSAREQTDRSATEKELGRIIDKTVSKGGIAVIPSFALRAPEIIMVLNKQKIKVPMYLDGMARKATEIALRHPQFLRNSIELKKAVSKVRMIKQHIERTKILAHPCVIVTTGGTLDGGPIVSYLKHLYAKKDCSLILTGFQFPKSAGNYLVETGRYVTDEFDLKLGMQLHQLSFSGHADRTELLRFVQKIRPKKVICMHGDQCHRFATELKGRFNIEGLAPKPGEILEL